MNMPTAELIDIIFMNEVELEMYEHESFVTDAWMRSSDHDVGATPHRRVRRPRNRCVA